MAICQSCREAAALTSKSADELKQAYETIITLGVAEYEGKFEDYLKETKHRAEFLHGKCRGGTHCFCQHSVESVVRDLA